MRNIGLQEVLNSYVDKGLSEVYTCIPCIVVEVFLEDQKVTVKPVINIKDNDENVSEQSEILGVPLIYPASSSSSFTFPVSVGDTVLCVFSQRSTDVFKSSSDGKPQAPNDFRKLSIRDAIAIPGLFPFKKSINNPKKHTYSHSVKDTVITHNIGKSSEVEIRLKPNGDCIVNSPTNVIVNATDSVEINTKDALINCETADVQASTSVSVTTAQAIISASASYSLTSPTMTFNGNMVVNGNFTMGSGGYSATFNGNFNSTGTFTNNGKDIGSTHTHSGVQTGSGNTGVPN